MKVGGGGRGAWRPEQFDRRLKSHRHRHRHRLWFVASSVASHLICPSAPDPLFFGLNFSRTFALLSTSTEIDCSPRTAAPAAAVPRFLYPIGLPLWHFHFIQSWVYFALKLLPRELPSRPRPPVLQSSSELSWASGPGKPTPRPKLWHSLGAKSLMEFVYGIVLPPGLPPIPPLAHRLSLRQNK